MTNFFQRLLAVFQETPAYVSLISENWIFISGDIESIGSLKSKIETIPNLYGAKGIRYLSEKELALFLCKLNAAGVSFLKDPKVRSCPCSIMNELQNEGLVVDDFSAISWTGYGKLTKTTISRTTCTQPTVESL